MMILNANSQVGLTTLRKVLKLTPGNMDYHTKTLETAKYIDKFTSFSFKKQKIVIKITETGRSAFNIYTNNLIILLNQNKEEY